MKQATKKRKSQQLTLLKQALIQTLREEKHLLYDLVAEVVEDYAMAAAIQEGRKTRPVKRETVFRELKGKA